MSEVYSRAVLARAMQPNPSPIVRYVTGNDRPYTDSTVTIAVHKDGTFSVVDENIVPERRGSLLAR